MAVATSAAMIAACGASDREIKAAVDSITKDDSVRRAPGGDTAAAAASAADSARRDSATRDSAARTPPAKRPD